MKYYIVYKITNHINNKIYVGVHKTMDIYDGYMSSSKLVANAIKKYGIENFSKEIIHHCDNEIMMYKKEAEIVTVDFCKRIDTYNIKVGGYGGWSHFNTGSDEHLNACRKGGKNCDHSICRGKPFEKNSKWVKQLSILANNTKREMWAKDPKKREKAVANMSTAKKINNPMTGKVWCVPIGSTNFKRDKKLFTKTTIPKGWISSTENKNIHKRKTGCYGKYWIHNPILKINKFHSGDMLEGWIKGRK